jgi:hypothetical protein
MGGRGFEVRRPSHELLRRENSKKSCECHHEPVGQAKDCFSPRAKALQIEPAETAVGGLREERQEQAGDEYPAGYEENNQARCVKRGQGDVPAKRNRKSGTDIGGEIRLVSLELVDEQPEEAKDGDTNRESD